jgi:hypothetical protein
MTNNTLIHEYLIPLITNIDFNECDNPTAMKTVICKLLTIAKKSMKNEKEPNDMSVLNDIDFSSSSAKIINTINSTKKTVTIKSDDSDEEIKKEINVNKKSDVKKETKKKETKKKETLNKNNTKTTIDISSNEDDDDSDKKDTVKDTKKTVRTPGKISDEENDNSDIEDAVSDDE